MKDRGVLAQVWASLGNAVSGGLPFLTVSEHMQQSWARTVKSYDDVPDVYRYAFETLVNEAGEFPYAVLTPSYRGFMKRGKEKLVACIGDKVCVLEETGNDLITTCYPHDGISCVEVGALLLQFWIEIRGTTAAGGLSSTRLEASAVTQDFLLPIVDRIRVSQNGVGEADWDVERDKFDYLASVNYKFMSYARRSIMRGEKVVHHVLQPEIRSEMLRMFGRSLYRTLSAPHITILTDREMILIRDGADKWWDSGIKYGGVWSYIPLNKITSVSLTREMANVLALSVGLPDGDTRKLLFAASNRDEVIALLGKLADSRPGMTVEYTL
jgi:hypothetical protein